MNDATNLFANIPANLPEEFVEKLLKTPNFQIERIVSLGHSSPEGSWYDQDKNEWVVLLQGAATIRFEDRLVEMNPGDFINIPAHQRHRVDWTDPTTPTVWLGVRYRD